VDAALETHQATRVLTYVDCENVSIDCLPELLRSIRDLGNSQKVSISEVRLYTRSPTTESRLDPWRKLGETHPSHPVISQFQYKRVVPLEIANFVDAVISVDMIRHARARTMDVAIVCSSDTDYSGAVDRLCRSGCRVIWIIRDDVRQSLCRAHRINQARWGTPEIDAARVEHRSFKAGEFQRLAFEARHRIVMAVVLPMLQGGKAVRHTHIKEALVEAHRLSFEPPWPTVHKQLTYSGLQSGKWVTGPGTIQLWLRPEDVLQIVLSCLASASDAAGWISWKSVAERLKTLGIPTRGSMAAFKRSEFGGLFEYRDPDFMKKMDT